MYCFIGFFEFKNKNQCNPYYFLQEREMDLEDLGTIRRIKLEQCVQLCQFENDANQVNLSLIHI